MTTQASEALEVVDLSDLDRLDDDKFHAYCNICYPHGVQPLVPFKATCGRTVVNRTVWAGRIPPANACPDCVAADHCVRCGAR